VRYYQFTANASAEIGNENLKKKSGLDIFSWNLIPVYLTDFASKDRPL
jgi:hypothetical protein